MRAIKPVRLLAATGVAAAAIIAQVGMAAPASAMYSGCMNYVKSSGYIDGPKVYNACANKATKLGFQWIPNQACVRGLINIRVSGSVAMAACERAHG
ncbi:hypothetical protein [Streptomyces sp. NPDC050504]|uniref:hypothetical protein n=1 Tax=Streptomyces sp. NPDC050504 TaxID=3365618 RepID=UPI003792E540